MIKEQITKLVTNLVKSKDFNETYKNSKSDISKKNLFIRICRKFEIDNDLKENSIVSKKVHILYLETLVSELKELQSKYTKKNKSEKTQPTITKESVYQGMVNMAKKTGQGVPYALFSKDRTHFNFINELIEEGKLKLVDSHSITHVVLTKGYVSEEDPNSFGLSYIRYYLGENDVFGQIKFSNKNYKGKTPREILMFEKEKEYNEWYLENKEKIEITESL